MIGLPIPILALIFMIGISLSAAGALLSLPRISRQETDLADERKKVAVNLSVATDLKRMIEESTGSVVTMKDLLARAEAALNDAQHRLSVQDLKLKSYALIVDGLRRQVAEHETKHAETMADQEF